MKFTLTGKPDAQLRERFINKNILDAKQFTKEDLEIVLNTAYHYEQCLNRKERLYDMDGKIMASLFFEPSTRTRLSFESAMKRLGGEVITVAESAGAHSSSMAKGESMRDTMIINDAYADVIVCRSPIQGAAKVAAEVTKHPVVNAGDGAGQHPSQALLDIYTMIKEKGGVDGLTIALAGDLANGRTVHSLVDFLAMYDVNIILASPESLKMPDIIKEDLHKSGIKYEETSDLAYAVAKADVVYMTRVQEERFANKEDFLKVKDEFIFDGEMLKKLKKDAIIMHPLPRINEITEDVDKYEGAAYFRQAANGIPIRMALLALVTGSVK